MRREGLAGVPAAASLPASRVRAGSRVRAAAGPAVGRGDGFGFFPLMALPSRTAALSGRSGVFRR
ncbi:hypothetical protein ADL27_05760 [Streptomyces sp. NRRL F-6602]|nr:hypothetical protein ADL27_05760 [Streptomyces sp. NRRL F-6602]